jgi:hypothetical protein
MLASARFFRWLTLLVSLAIEAFAFWYGGPQGDPQASLLSNLTLKAESAGSWAWLGWVSFSLTWLCLELAHYPFANGRRIRSFVSKDERLLYETGLHWLVLIRDIRTGELNDGNEREVNEDLFPTEGYRRS